jgi:hypothetical protein
VIQAAMGSYVARLAGALPEHYRLADGTVLRAGGDARVVAFVGHNGWMDVDSYDFGKRLAGTDGRRRAAIALACATAPYLARTIASPTRVPILMTATLLFAGAHGFEGTVSEFARAGSYRQIRVSSRLRTEGSPKTPTPPPKRWRRCSLPGLWRIPRSRAR